MTTKELYKKIKRTFLYYTEKEFKKKYRHLPPKLYPIIFDNRRIVQLAEKSGVSFLHEENRLVANIPIFSSIIKFILDKQVCFQLLNEQFIKRSSYNFILNKPVVVIDIGMNVGDTALFFAANPYVKKVYSYELMPQIYNRALRNFKLNLEIESKIKRHDYGLGKCDQEIDIPYFDDFDLGNGAFNDARRERFGKGDLTACKIKSVTSEMQRIIKDYPNTDLYLKIDAEGAEYEIIDTIFQEKLDYNICYIALEYHFGFQNIIETLKDHHFEVMESFYGYTKNTDTKYGNISAIRLNTKM